MPQLKGARRADRATIAPDGRPALKEGGGRVIDHRKARKASSKPAKVQDKEKTAPCVRCHAHSSVFYCEVCLSERIVSHHVNVRRVDEMRRESQGRVEGLFGFGQEAEAADFTPHAVTGRIDSLRRMRAAQARLWQTIQETRERHEELHRANLARAKEALKKRVDLSQRIEILQRAKNVFPVSVTVVSLRREVQQLRYQSQLIAVKIAETRALLARETLSIFHVAPPVGTLAEARRTQRLGSSERKVDRSKERYVPGAFLQAPPPLRDRLESVTQVNVNDWTIMKLVLPLPSDVKRFERGQVNGAIVHTVHLLHLLAYYLGVALPFSMTVPQGMPIIRPNTLWGSGTKQSLYLSSSTYTALPASQTKDAGTGSTLGNMGASMMSTLGASTMSTLESFVHLPGGTNLPWAKNAPSSAAAGKVPIKGVSQTAEGSGEKLSVAVKQYYTACTMLAYDIAYLASIEGVKVDLLIAAGSPLRMLSKTVDSPFLGKKAHTTSSAASKVDSLLFPQLDFTQFAQVFEPGSVPGVKPNQTTGGMQTKVKERRGTVQPTSINTQPPPMLEGSYIDAQQAAESILMDRHKSPNPSTSRSSRQQYLPSTSAQAAALSETPSEATITATRKQKSPELRSTPSAAQRPGTLDFLRQTPNSSLAKRENKNQPKSSHNRPVESSAAKAKAKATSPLRPTSGTVMFNGKEVRATADKARRTSVSSRKAEEDGRKGDDEGWALV